jgi:putative flippase GtrA
LRKNQNEFLRLQGSAIIGSALDYLVTIAGVSLFQVWYLAANIAGNLTGGALQFILNKKWVFQGTEGHTGKQTGKFVLVFAGNILLSAFIVYLLTSISHINYLISKTITSVLLGTTYNYILQKRFVFAQRP